MPKFLTYSLSHFLGIPIVMEHHVLTHTPTILLTHIYLLMLSTFINFSISYAHAGWHECKNCCVPCPPQATNEGPRDSTRVGAQEEKCHCLLFLKIFLKNGKRTEVIHISRNNTPELFICKGQSSWSSPPTPTINNSDPPKASEWPTGTEAAHMTDQSFLFSITWTLFQVPGQMHMSHK